MEEMPEHEQAARSRRAVTEMPHVGSDEPRKVWVRTKPRPVVQVEPRRTKDGRFKRSGGKKEGQ